ncbi:hypothetical protein SAMN04487998_1071 [Hymenobacter actinosclerus]|uniref:Uncharacterized protein n=1 Tax=Hymenobacter actinosclerus TaxID=82805 RepID=A0A1I0BHV7_9BACT|nr:hypothetical protein SAMN04487998_1071 [Hymenobacter actinosclerus]
MQRFTTFLRFFLLFALLLVGAANRPQSTPRVSLTDEVLALFRTTTIPRT